jgi:hypothetical protein
LRNVRWCFAELAAKFIQFVLKLARLIHELSIQDRNDALVKAPKGVKRHFLQLTDFHVMPPALQEALCLEFERCMASAI